MPNPDNAWPDSLWCASAEPLETLPVLKSSLNTDVLVIGAGYTGLSTALYLRESGFDVVVIDRAQPGWGCSGRNGGQVNPGLETITCPYSSALPPVIALRHSSK